MIIESQKGNRNHCWLENITGEIDRIDTRRLLVVGRARLAARRDRRQPARCAPGPRVLARILSGAFLAYGTVSAGRLPLMQNFPMIFSEPH